MNSKTKQQVCLEFCFWLEKPPRDDSIALLKNAFGDECQSNSSFKKWHKEFKNGRKSVQDAPWCGRPKTLLTEINTSTVTSYIEDDQHLSASTLASPRLLERVRLAYLRCNPQNMTSLICRCTECTHTQYVLVRYG